MPGAGSTQGEGVFAEKELPVLELSFLVSGGCTKLVLCYLFQ